MQDDSMDGVGRVESGTETEQLSRVKLKARIEIVGTREGINVKRSIKP